MSEIKSIFGDLKNADAKDDETKLVKNIKDFIKDSEKLTSILIYEDDRNIINMNRSAYDVKKNYSKRNVPLYDA